MKRPGNASPTVRIADPVVSGSRPQIDAIPVPIVSVDVAASRTAARLNASLPPGASPNHSAAYPSSSTSAANARSSLAGGP